MTTTSNVNGANGVNATTGFSRISNECLTSATQIMASIDELGAKLERKNQEATSLRDMKDKATAMDGGRVNGVITFTKRDASGNEVVDVDKAQNLLDYIKFNNEVFKDEPTKQITAFDSGNADVGTITVAQLNSLDIKVNGISLFSKETASAALSSLGNQITAKLGLIEKDTIDLNKLGNNYKNVIDLGAAMISILTKIMDGILQRM